MIETQPKPTFRKDYQRPAYDIERVDLRFELDPKRTRVLARMDVRRTEGVDPVVSQQRMRVLNSRPAAVA